MGRLEQEREQEIPSNHRCERDRVFGSPIEVCKEDPILEEKDFSNINTWCNINEGSLIGRRSSLTQIPHLEASL